MMKIYMRSLNQSKGLIQEMNEYELQLLLSDPYDKNNAILELHPGAGGTESQDWGSMLYVCTHVGLKNVGLK